MSARSKIAVDCVRRILAERSFSNIQIEKLLPRLHEDQMRHSETLSEIIDCWNNLMSKASSQEFMQREETAYRTPAVANPPINSPVGKQKVNMSTILAEVEPDLLRLSPQKLITRHQNLLGLGIINNTAESWIVLFNAPRGFYLQDWFELTRKIMYIEHKVIDLIYDKREQREIDVHPIVSSAAVTETDFDHIRTRYLFAERTGYTSLSHMRSVQTSMSRPSLKDMILSEDEVYLKQFAPFCSVEEFSCFSNLIKNHEIDEEDADIISKLAELNSLRHPSTIGAPTRFDKMRDDEVD